MGRPGKLILVARELDVGGVHLRLRSFGLPAEGHDASKTVTTFAVATTFAMPIAGLLAIGMTGGNIEYPAGTHAIVKLAADMFIPAPSQTDPNPPRAATSKDSTP